MSHQVARIRHLLLRTAVVFLTVLEMASGVANAGVRQLLFGSGLRDTEAELARLDQQIRNLPEPGAANSTDSLGFHSEGFFRPDGPYPITVDLQQVHAVDMIVLVSARTLVANSGTWGYGFPVRFRIELATREDFRDKKLVADETNRDYDGQQRYPYIVQFPSMPARYVRLTVTCHWKRTEQLWLTALSEMMVFSGQRNVALQKKVLCQECRRSNRWSPEALVDGVTPIGLPGNVVPSPSNGYHSKIASRPDSLKWVQVDLGSSLPIEEVHLIPSYPVDWLDPAGFGFPVRYRVDVSDDAAFRSYRTIYENGRGGLPPGNNEVILSGKGLSGRFVRVTTLELYESAPRRFVFALSEVLVISGGRVVSIGRPVTALDEMNFAPRPLWSKQFLTDGYSSERQLIPSSDWIRQIDLRHRLEQERRALQVRREREIGQSMERANWMLGALAVTGLLAALMIWYLGWRAREQQATAIRSRVARDLHDEVGSNLAAVIHLSGALEAEVEDPSLRAELGHIRQVARETSDALRDVVWMLQNRRSSPADLAQHMEDIAKRMLKGRNVEVRWTQPAATASLRFDIRRNVLLAFREILSNVIQHSDARNVKVWMSTENGKIRFRVVDDGRGFDPDGSSLGWGLRNLRKRAEELRGAVRVESAFGEGSSVEFEAPLR
jgi:signal transduction histidine kinase